MPSDPVLWRTEFGRQLENKIKFQWRHACDQRGHLLFSSGPIKLSGLGDCVGQNSTELMIGSSSIPSPSMKSSRPPAIETMFKGAFAVALR